MDPWDKPEDDNNGYERKGRSMTRAQADWLPGMASRRRQKII